MKWGCVMPPETVPSAMSRRCPSRWALRLAVTGLGRRQVGRHDVTDGWRGPRTRGCSPCLCRWLAVAAPRLTHSRDREKRLPLFQATEFGIVSYVALFILYFLSIAN